MLYRAMLPLLLVAVFLTAGVPAKAQLPNLTYKYDSNFQYPLVPTIAYIAPPVFVPATLPGNSETIYWNFIGMNSGAGDTPGGFYSAVRVDGTNSASWYSAGAGAGNIIALNGSTPYNIRGGRHTLEILHDSQEDVIESDEFDNWWAHQFIFTPYVLSAHTPKDRGAPPAYDGGWSSIVDGSPFDVNCDGFRITCLDSSWTAVTMYAQDDADDYDLELHHPSTGSEDGFIGSFKGSYSAAGHLDAVLINGHMAGCSDYDVGVYNANGGNGWFAIEHRLADPTVIGITYGHSLAANDFLRIYDVQITPADLGWVTVTVEDTSADGQEFFAGWLDNTTSYASLSDVIEWEITDETGIARLHRNFTTSGNYGLVVLRRPHDGRGPKLVTVAFEQTSPDFTPMYEPGWIPPLVPTPTPLTMKPTALPDTLHGYMPETYLNFTFANVSNVWTPTVDVTVTQDGQPWNIPFSYGIFAPMVYWEELDTVAREFPGGRHTLTLSVDPEDFIYEFNEDNNIFAEQFCWSPLELSTGWQYGHIAPGPAVGGINDIDPMEPIYYNCDGYRLYTGYSEWEGMVLTQGPNSDYDLNIYDALTGVKDGFKDGLATSAFYEGDTDYVLFNNQLLPAMAHDIGVVNFLGDEPYTIEAVGSTNLPIPVGGNYGPYTMPISNMLHLYNIYLEQDVCAFRLDNLGDPVDWGFALHRNDVGYQGRQESLPDGAAYLNGPGGPEMFTVNVPTAGFYVLAVFKATPFGFDIEGEYILTILQGVSDVPDEPDLPSMTALAGAHPNPFNPQTTISFDLASPTSVELNIYDLKGALVRRLVSEPMPAGRHEAVWDGKNDSGSRAASGVYLARFVAGDHHDITKLVMVK